MIEFGAFALLRPSWLLALPATVLLFRLARPLRGDIVDWKRAIDPHLLLAMTKRGLVVAGAAPRLPLVFWACLLIVVALAGPALRRAGRDGYSNLDATLIVMDLSGSATSQAQLREARTAAHLVLERAGGRQTGLILYAGDAYLASPLTDDNAATDALVFALDAQTVPDPGVYPERALALARKIIAEAEIVNADVILISAGEGLDEAAFREGRLLTEAGVTLHTLFLPKSDEPKDAEAQRRQALFELAAPSKGLAADVAKPQTLLDLVAGRAIAHIGSSVIVALTWHDQGRLLLVGPAFLLLLSFRRSLA